MEVLTHIPEIPVKENWEWLSDILTSNDGSEQRIAIRGSVPRVSQDLKYRFTSTYDIRKFWNTLLGGRGVFYLPEYQYSTKISSKSLSGSSRVYYGPDKTDIRVGEKVIIKNELFEVNSVYSDGCDFTTNLTFDLEIGDMIAPVAESVLDDNSTLSRFSVNEVSDARIKATYNRNRSQLSRPGTSASYALWNSIPVLDVRPISDGVIDTTIIEGQFLLDNKIGPINLINNYNYPKISTSRKFIVDRVIESQCNTETRRSSDYWRHFFEYCRGSARKFWMSTFRSDLEISGAVSDGASNILVEGTEYSNLIFDLMTTHRNIEIVTSNGTHMCEITSSSVEGSNSRLQISPSLPSGWTDVERISFLLPMRIGGDSVTWEHYGLHSFLNFSVRLAE